MNITTKEIIENYKSKDLTIRKETIRYRRQDKKMMDSIQNMTIVPFVSLDGDKIKQVLRSQPYNYDFMTQLKSQLDSRFRTGSIPSLVELEPRIYEARFDNHVMALIKSQGTDDTEIDMGREAYIGLIMNHLRKFIPNFVMTYSLSKIREEQALLLEYVSPSTSLKDLIKNCRIDEAVSILAQVCLSLKMAYKLVEFTHYDLHDGNVLIRKGKKSSWIAYEDLYVRSDLIATIIDFGYSHVKCKGVSIGIYGFTNYGIRADKPFPMHDVYKIYMYILYYSIRYNQSVYNDLKVLYRFFNQNENDKTAIMGQIDSSFSLPYRHDLASVSHQDFIDFMMEKFPHMIFKEQKPWMNIDSVKW